MRCLTSTFVFLLLLISCKPRIPEGVLPPAKMQPVLWDVLQADEMAGYYAGADSSFTRVAKHAEYYQSIFRIHKTNEQTFKNSIRFYMSHPSLFKPILDSIQAFGERLPHKDSIPKAITPLGEKIRKITKVE